MKIKITIDTDHKVFQWRDRGGQIAHVLRLFGIDFQHGFDWGRIPEDQKDSDGNVIATVEFDPPLETHSLKIELGDDGTLDRIFHVDCERCHRFWTERFTNDPEGLCPVTLEDAREIIEDAHSDLCTRSARP